MGIRWTEDEYRAHLGKFKAPAHATVPAADAQPAKRARSKKQDEGEKIHPVYRVHVHSKRRRRTDSDGVSIKSAIDGLVHGGLLGDDSPDWIPETPTQSQEKSETEETTIEVWEV